MNVRTRKPAPAPVIDLGGRVAVIAEVNGRMVYKTVERVFPASKVKAAEVLRRHGFAGGWLIDGTGDREWVDA